MSSAKYCSKAGKTYKLVMLRHGKSEWNDVFCGWYDAKLSEKGKNEALVAGGALKDAGYKFDIAHTSLLTRAHETLAEILNMIGQNDLLVQKSWRLNERHYGGLTGLNKAEIVDKYGEIQVAIWRRGFDVLPPPMKPGHSYYESIVKDPRYADGPAQVEFPMVESLKTTIMRVMPYWYDVIAPQIKQGKRILIVAHGTSLRGIIKHIDKISDEDIRDLNIPNAMPFFYELDENLHPIPGGSLQFLGNEATVKAAQAAIVAQGKSKK